MSPTRCRPGSANRTEAAGGWPIPSPSAISLRRLGPSLAPTVIHQRHPAPAATPPATPRESLAQPRRPRIAERHAQRHCAAKRVNTSNQPLDRTTIDNPAIELRHARLGECHNSAPRRIGCLRQGTARFPQRVAAARPRCADHATCPMPQAPGSGAPSKPRPAAHSDAPVA